MINIDTNNEMFIKSSNNSSELMKFIRENKQFRVIDKKVIKVNYFFF